LLATRDEFAKQQAINKITLARPSTRSERAIIRNILY